MSSNFINNFIGFLLKKIRIIVLCAAIGAAMALLVCIFGITPKYRATATAAITISDEYVEDATSTYVKTQSDLANAIVNYFNEEYIYYGIYVNQPSGLSKVYPLDEIREMFSVSNEEGTFIIQTTAIADTPTDAEILCNYYTTYTLENTLNLIGLGYYETVKAATAPSSKYSPSYLKGAFIGAFFAVALFCSITLLLMSFGNYIVTRRDLEEIFQEIPVLSEVASI